MNLVYRILTEEFPDDEIAFEQMRSHIRRAIGDKKKGFKKEPEKPKPYKSSIEYKSDGTVIHDKLIEIMDNEDITPEVIIKAHGLDVDRWEVIAYRNNYWHSQVKGGTRLVMYQSRLTVKPKKDGLSLDKIDEFFKKLDREYCKPAIIPRRTAGNLMAEVNIADLHLGKLCWHGDTPENYDYKIARENYQQIINDIIHELKNKPIEKIIFVWANDFFNTDTIGKTTTAGTPQDVDIRWQKLYDVGCEMLISGIDMLSDVATVETFWTPSNHDKMTGYHAVKVLEAWFRKERGVTIDTGAQPRRYMQYGNTLLGFAHGCDIQSKGTKYRASQLAALMPVEARELWGQTQYHEMHVGHLHSESSIEEINGVIVRRISSPTATDTWHNENGYVGAVRKAQTFIYDRDKGLRQVINTPV